MNGACSSATSTDGPPAGPSGGSASRSRAPSDPDSIRCPNQLIQAGRDCRTADPDHAAPVLERLAALAPQAGEPEPFEGLDFRPRPMAFQPLGPSAGVRPRRRGKA